MLNNNIVMKIKKTTKKLNLEKKKEILYEKTSELINDKFNDINTQIENISEEINKSLSLSEEITDDITNNIFTEYIKLHNNIDKVMNEMNEIREFRHQEVRPILEQIKDIYIYSMNFYLGNIGKDEKNNYIMCLIGGFLCDYSRWISEFVEDNKKITKKKHEELGYSLEYIFGITEEELEEIIHIQKKYKLQIKYISDVRGLIKFAKNLGFLEKSQNGSHIKFEHITTKECVIVPYHQELKKGTSINIQKQLIEKSIKVA